MSRDPLFYFAAKVSPLLRVFFVRATGSRRALSCSLFRLGQFQIEHEGRDADRKIRHYSLGSWHLIMALMVSLVTSPCDARTWRIHPNLQGDAPTVQAGIDSSSAGDTVLVSPGTYYENIDFNGKNVVVRSENGPLVTTLDGSSGNDSVVKFHNRESRAAMIIGFTITGGEGTRDFGSPSGGGIKVLDGSPTIKGNRIIGNSVSTDVGNGGGIGVGLASMPLPRPNPLIEWNLIENNSVIGNGGGLSIFHADAEVRNNVFRSNHTIGEGDGGAIWVVYYDAQAVISANEFWENEARDHGGAIYAGDIGGTGTLTINRNLLVRNQADGIGTGDSGSGGAMWLFVTSGAVTSNTMVGNRGYGESGCSGGGILLDGTPSDLDVSANIIAFSDGCGIACKDNVKTTLGPNLLWQNVGGDIGTGSGLCPAGWVGNQIIADPLFCNPATDIYTVANTSPALIGELSMGAFTNPGCGPVVSVTNVTWGRLKAMYR